MEPGDLVGRLRTLEEVMRWAHAGGAEMVDVIGQDEFTNDVVFRDRDARWLVFDTT